MSEAVLVGLFSFLGILVTQIITFLRQKQWSKVKFTEIKKENEILTEKITKIDNLQTVEIKQLNEKIDSLPQINNTEVIDKMAQQLDYLTELHKYTDFQKKLKTKLEQTSDNVIILKDFKNQELKQAIGIGLEKFRNVCDEILGLDFEIDLMKIKELIYTSLKSVKNSITLKKICIKESENFLENIENKIIKKYTELFLIELQEIMKLTNGIRRKEFQLICVNLIKNIVSGIIDLYDEETRVYN